MLGLVVGVEATGVGEDPDARGADALFLGPDVCPFVGEAAAVRADADEGDPLWLVAYGLALESLGAFQKFFVAELRGGGGGAGDHVGHAAAVLGEEAVFGGGEQSVGETRAVERGPEAVAGAGEVVADRAGIESGVDAAEEDLEPGGDDVREAGAGRGGELLRCGAGGLHGMSLVRK